MPSSGFVDIWYNKDWTDGFLWKIPRGQTEEYGMLGSSPKFDDLEKFFNIKGKVKWIEKRAGSIPIGPTKTYFDRVLLIGDAAGMCKPWSGGGVIYSLTAAEIAAWTIKQAKDANDFSEKFLKKYEKGWKKSFGRQIKAGKVGMSVFKKMNNNQLNFAFSSMKRTRFLMNRLDMDFFVKK